eukprot:42546-Pleurochrysis_carterae.AAC.1
MMGCRLDAMSLRRRTAMQGRSVAARSQQAQRQQPAERQQPADPQQATAARWRQGQVRRAAVMEPEVVVLVLLPGGGGVTATMRKVARGPEARAALAAALGLETPYQLDGYALILLRRRCKRGVAARMSQGAVGVARMVARRSNGKVNASASSMDTTNVSKSKSRSVEEQPCDFLNLWDEQMPLVHAWRRLATPDTRGARLPAVFGSSRKPVPGAAWILLLQRIHFPPHVPPMPPRMREPSSSVVEHPAESALTEHTPSRPACIVASSMASAPPMLTTHTHLPPSPSPLTPSMPPLSAPSPPL